MSHGQRRFGRVAAEVVTSWQLSGAEHQSGPPSASCLSTGSQLENDLSSYPHDSVTTTLDGTQSTAFLWTLIRSHPSHSDHRLIYMTRHAMPSPGVRDAIALC